ncbi:hypothetical protein [Marinomonas ostreistagni]|uniref:hypothetical protein n=1 Tax=Marinomonas ostreistagni TaxID=359209 RepID=UPI00194ECFA8|nr:hypothetical protein [Marinomonas ostreistagni]MBM6552164.1 hypothetical protein [Marinomonas ostreistagni]
MNNKWIFALLGVVSVALSGCTYNHFYQHEPNSRVIIPYQPMYSPAPAQAAEPIETTEKTVIYRVH